LMLNNYKYVGCYNVNSSSFNKNLIGDDLTIYNCVKLANEKGYKYFGFKKLKKGTYKNISIDLDNNKLYVEPFALGECYGENDIDLTKQVSSNNCVSHLFTSYTKYYDVINNQIVNTDNTKSNEKYNNGSINVATYPMGTSDSISIFEKSN
jgi:hypothetical protein